MGHQEENEMKNGLLIVVSLIIVYIVWRIVMPLLVGVVAIAFNLALIALFCYAVYRVYQALNREKIT